MANRGIVAQVAGKPYWREREAKLVVGAWRQSGKPLARFAREHGMSRQRVQRWVGRIQAGRARAKGPKEVVRFHPVRLLEGGEAFGERYVIEVVLVSGRRLRVPEGFATEELRRVLAVVEGA